MANWCFSLELSCSRLLSTSGDRESGVKAEALPAFLPVSGSSCRAQNRQDLLTKLGDLEDSTGPLAVSLPHLPEEPLRPLRGGGAIPTSRLVFHDRCMNFGTRKGNLRVSRDKEEQRKSTHLQVILNHDTLKNSSRRTRCRQLLILKSSNGIAPNLLSS